MPASTPRRCRSATFDGTVTLSGHVSSWLEHDAAVNAAWAAPGVRAVEDEIVVDY